MNSRRKKRLLWLLFSLAGLSVVVALVLYALSEQASYYYDPSQVLAGEAPENTPIRAGGMVVAGSVVRNPDNPTTVDFKVTDFEAVLPMRHTGILPDLFKENSGVVAVGELVNGVFVASEVLAKHDENYMPPEVAKSLKNQHQAQQNPQ